MAPGIFITVVLMFIVVAQDAGTPPKFAWTTVNVIVRDVNDNHPQFQPLDGSTDPPILIRLRIPEQSDEPELIYVVSAQDADFGENSRISYSITGMCCVS